MATKYQPEAALDMLKKLQTTCLATTIIFNNNFFIHRDRLQTVN